MVSKLVKCKVLGRALLWSVFDTEQTSVVPNFMVHRIKEEYKKSDHGGKTDIRWREPN